MQRWPILWFCIRCLGPDSRGSQLFAVPVAPELQASPLELLPSGQRVPNGTVDNLTPYCTNSAVVRSIVLILWYVVKNMLSPLDVDNSSFRSSLKLRFESTIDLSNAFIRSNNRDCSLLAIPFLICYLLLLELDTGDWWVKNSVAKDDIQGRIIQEHGQFDIFTPIFNSIYGSKDDSRSSRIPFRDADLIKIVSMMQLSKDVTSCLFTFYARLTEIIRRTWKWSRYLWRGSFKYGNFYNMITLTLLSHNVL